MTTPKNEVALSYYRVRGLHFLAVVFASTIIFNPVTLISTIQHERPAQANKNTEKKKGGEERLKER